MVDEKNALGAADAAAAAPELVALIRARNANCKALK